MKKNCILLITFLLISLLLSACANSNKETEIVPYERQDFVMGTIVTQRIFGENAEEAASEVIERIREIEANMTINEPGGKINEINRAAGENYVSLDEDSFFVLKRAIYHSELSKGAFDITIGPLMKAWNILGDNPVVPHKDFIQQLLKLVDYKDIKIDENGMKVKLEKKGQIIDFGGIAKGYAGDEAVKIYKKYGIESALINLGGDVVVLGEKPDGDLWRIGIQNPRDAHGKYVAIVEVSDKTVVTSGDYERYFEVEGTKYHHILNPKTGYPAQAGIISSTIVADNSIDADALSTSTFILGLDEGRKLVESLEGVEAVFITDDKKVYATEGMKDMLTFIDESGEFEYVEKS